MNKGLKDYEGQLRTHVTKQLTSQLEPITKELRDSIHKLSNSKNSVSNDFEKKLANIVRAELRSMSSTPTTRSTTGASPATTTVTAVPTMAEIQAQVNLKLSEGKINEAFATALSANNLVVVVATCEMVNPNQIFNQTPCPLSQEVLLSLIQQLGKFNPINYFLSNSL
jgi:enhancer of mRNA-decapping protein 4